MIALKDLESIKSLIKIQELTERTRPIYFITEGNIITWKNPSDFFSLDSFKVGSKLLNSKGIPYDLSSKRVHTEEIPRIVYGMRIVVNIIPIVNENEDVVGSLAIYNPRLHPIAAAFYDYSPILTALIPDKIVIFTTNLFECSHRYTTEGFNLPIYEMNERLREGDIATRTIKAGHMMSENVDASKYGVPVFVACYPLITVDNQIVGSFGIAFEKKTAAHLRAMSEGLEGRLNHISEAIEELAASSTQIHENEQALNSGIKDIHHHSNSINNISSFIKKVADEIKMLGLNAAIEAARAGQAGKGFGVVADEIRKLSEQSNSTVPQIETLTSKINNAVDKRQRFPYRHAVK